MRHRKSDSNNGEWDEFEMKHCLDPSRPRAYYGDMVPAMLASGQGGNSMENSFELKTTLRFGDTEIG